jgi:hypothetical protein
MLTLYIFVSHLFHTLFMPYIWAKACGSSCVVLVSLVRYQTQLKIVGQFCPKILDFKSVENPFYGALEKLRKANITFAMSLCLPFFHSHGTTRLHLEGFSLNLIKDKGHPHNWPQGPKGVPGRLRLRIFLTFGTTRVVGRQPHAPAAFTPRGTPLYSFLEADSTPGHMVPSVATEKFPSVTPPGIDPETVRLVAHCLNHYATPLNLILKYFSKVCTKN